MMRKIFIDQKGFTLVEISIAMAIFGSIIVIVLVGLIGIMRLYRNGLAQRDTHNAAHYMLDNIVRDARSGVRVVVHNTVGGGDNKVTGTGPLEIDAFCLDQGGTSYRYYVSGGDMYRRIETDVDGCPDTNDAPANDTPISTLSTATKVIKLDVAPYSYLGTDRGIDISVTVGTKNDTFTGGVCPTGPGSEFCSLTGLDTSAAFRGGN